MNTILRNQQSTESSSNLPVDSEVDLALPRSPRVIFFILLHVPLALLMIRAPSIATLHSIITVVIGLWLAAFGRRIDRLIRIGGYIVGAEVLWRMSHASVFWEFGKYAIAAIFIIALLRHSRLKSSRLPFVFFLLLIPSIGLTVFEARNTATLRTLLSSNLSGPFTLVICTVFFSRFKFTLKQLYSLFLSMTAPIVGIASFTLLTTPEPSTIRFYTESMVETSGGFAPNQVSSILGLGVLLCFLFLMLHDKERWGFKILIFGGMIFFGIQSALTFSRGGLYMAAGSAIVASGFLLMEARARFMLILVAASLLVVTSYIAFPYLETFTRGKITERFQDVNPTGRERIILADLDIWLDNPIFGVGPGMAKVYRESKYRRKSAHTEFTRLLAEHGVFGLAALILLLAMAGQSLTRGSTKRHKAVVTSMICWSLLYMFINAMRLAAPAFVFGLAFITIPEENTGAFNSPKTDDIRQ